VSDALVGSRVCEYVTGVVDSSWTIWSDTRDDSIDIGTANDEMLVMATSNTAQKRP